MSEVYEQLRSQRVAEAKAEGDRYRQLSESVSSELTGTWAAMASEDLVRVMELVARKIHAVYEEHIDFEDVMQDVWVEFASNVKLFDFAQAVLAGEEEHTLGALAHRLLMDMIDHYRPISKRQGWYIPHDSIEKLREEGVEI